MSMTVVSPSLRTVSNSLFGRNLLNEVPEVTIFFWVIKILCKPRAQARHERGQSKANGGLGLGMGTTSNIFFATVLALVLYLSITRVDQTPPKPEGAPS